MNKSINIEYFKTKLLTEKKTLENELGDIAVTNPQSADSNSTWRAKQTMEDESIKADPNEVADKLEEFETNESIIQNLKVQLKEVDDALAKIEKGTYGI